ncbi:class I SAM-dependent methyltransferase [Nocardioides lianchengensis]|uniref:Methyltransferase domain-containing protein n=1 Tax=Nocardioides lianchengensis TaxID=1045774 RepID=A0A1G6PK38_9ACTN|nr:class I SAM-dependent methyltransferase [Nocardioides lianchengensis]NYG11877.1 ubiquinone/menaquinone biosynthesis C-methylase UbiE [Nocardioides lianchengensis]SDC80351.1 Methyltransferase domain-containing protein [Nocardioides lianchengensis]
MRLLGGWSDDPVYAAAYDWSVEHPRAGGLAWRLAMGSDLDLLYDAAREISVQPRGARVLDVPCGGGVAVRALRPAQGVEYVAADLSPAMLARTARLAERRGVESLVTTVEADVGALPFADASYDLVVSFTGLHCFPDPARAITELVRVLRPGGVITGSAFLNDTGLRYEPARRVGRLTGLLGPGCTGDQLIAWLTRLDVQDVTLRTSGALAYFRGVRAG